MGYGKGQVWPAVLLLFCVAATVTREGAAAQAPPPRIALVIGNAAYASGPLSNPVNDGRLMADTLRGLGFDVLSRSDANQQTMKRAIQEFGARLEKAGPDAVGLFYYAGHGVQLAGRNFLVPVGAKIDREGDVDIESVSAEWVMDQMRYARNRLNIVILDACRNNPFARASRSADRGLARMDAPAGTLIAYSTAPGDVAADGDGRNSPYTLALTSAMAQGREPVEQVFKRARVAVMSATSNRQTPWESSSLTGDFFFATSGSVGSPPPSLPPVARVEPKPAQPPPAPVRSADPCQGPVGRWRVNGLFGEVAIIGDQTLEWRMAARDRKPAVSGSWFCQSAQSRRFVFRWNNGDVSTLDLSADGEGLTGRNALGVPVLMTRLH